MIFEPKSDLRTVKVPENLLNASFGMSEIFVIVAVGVVVLPPGTRLDTMAKMARVWRGLSQRIVTKVGFNERL